MLKKSGRQSAKFVFALMFGLCFATISSAEEERPRARDIGLIVGIFEPGPLKDWTYEQLGMGEHTVNPIIGETIDSYLNDMWADPVQRKAVFAALDSASDGPVTEGSVGTGTGTRAFGWKGGIGTSSRVLPGPLGGYTVGVLLQTNYGDTLSMNGAPVGRELGQDIASLARYGLVTILLRHRIAVT